LPLAFAGAAAGVAAAAAAGLASVVAAFFPRCFLAAGDAAGLASGDVAGEASVAAFLPLVFLAFAGDAAGEAAGLGVGVGSAAFTAKGAATNAVAMIRVIRERICSKINPAKTRWFRYFNADNLRPNKDLTQRRQDAKVEKR
jgi:hypothetical protein